MKNSEEIAQKLALEFVKKNTAATLADQFAKEYLEAFSTIAATLNQNPEGKKQQP